MATPYVPYSGPVVTRAQAKAAGLTWYFTGQPCKAGHIAQRRLDNYSCERCLRLNRAAHYAKNPEAERQLRRAYYAATAVRKPLTPRGNGLPTFEQVADYVAYNPLSGLFTWRKTRRRFHAGCAAGYLNPNGYIVINLFFRPIRAHRLAWLLSYGEWPPGKIDHRNSNRADNRLSNLRLADNYQNAWNVLAHSDSSSGFKGVTYIGRRSKPWQARIKFKGNGKTLGYFATAEEAHAAYIEAATRLFGEFANDGEEKVDRC